MELFKIMFSWPTVAIFAIMAFMVISFRHQISEFIRELVKSGSIRRAKIGPLEIELGQLAEQGKQAVNNLEKITHLMAESRLLELEITDGKFGPFFTDEQRSRMKKHIDELKELMKQDDKS